MSTAIVYYYIKMTKLRKIRNVLNMVQFYEAMGMKPQKIGMLEIAKKKLSGKDIRFDKVSSVFQI